MVNLAQMTAAQLTQAYRNSGVTGLNITRPQYKGMATSFGTHMYAVRLVDAEDPSDFSDGTIFVSFDEKTLQVTADF